MKSFRKQSVTKTMYRYAYAEYLMHLGVLCASSADPDPTPTYGLTQQQYNNGGTL